ncbi:hypothetical protein CAPTEDRAFT_196282 [Capitella teleta]|uniref:Uncharacterized protein n=1 Tax=Capitella teleta TaxID=283909 RepID=R7T4K0_CAPTE|nr:hypothetical protein CAPTEDRAFT_196282 [Capitella teleta]|eukprot:ELT87858.1 hypothetical protein CAPTEDRAFT_196282 [Capitella teleta]
MFTKPILSPLPKEYNKSPPPNPIRRASTPIPTLSPIVSLTSPPTSPTSPLHQNVTFHLNYEKSETKPGETTERENNTETSESVHTSDTDPTTSRAPWQVVTNGNQQVKGFREILREANAEARQLKSQNYKDRKKHDEDHIDELLKFLEIDASISNIQRLGRRLNPSEESQESENTEVVNADNINTKRPLKITLTSEEDVAKIFANLYKLKDTEDTMKSIRVSHDLNKEQREEMRELVQRQKT